jgi:alpha-mannosidase
VRSILLVVSLGVMLSATLPGASGAADAEPTAHVVATSHLDTQWRWTIQTTIDEYLRDTLDENLALLESYPEYVFSFEGAFRYQLMKEYYPERFARMKRMIDAGRWHVCGSWLDAVDVNMPSPEALFRHTLYGNGWFEREFGQRSVDVFLPDCFGFGYALPSIMAHSGLTGFSTQKLTWGSAYGTPFDLGRWRGVDGAEVIAAVNPGAYVTDLTTDLSRDSTVVAAIERTVAAGGPPIAYRYYGTGDTGGAPSESSVQQLVASMESDGPVRVVPAGADQLFRELSAEQIASLPVYDGELVMTSHGAGCYTSQAAMKRWNRRCEVLADAAERAASLAWLLGGEPYPAATLERAWTRFLWHGFHDDLTGTSIPEAYTFSWNDLLLSQQEFAQVLETSLASIATGLDTRIDGRPIGSVPLVLFNPLGHAREEVVIFEGHVPHPFSVAPMIHVFGPDGEEVPATALDTGERHPVDPAPLAFTARVPASGVAVYELRVAPPQNPAERRNRRQAHGWNPDTGTLDTDRYRLRFSTEGLVSLIDKRTDRELLAAPPRLQLLHNQPENWAAWEIDHDDIMADPYAEVPLGGIPETVIASEDIARLSFTHEAAGSTFRQTLTVADDRLDLELDIDWATKATLLKAAFFTTARDTAVTYDLGLGTIRRGLNRPQLYEVPAQRWADLTDASGDFGLTIMNDGRHGWDHPDPGTLRLTLLHTPAVSKGWRWIDDQKSQDLGRHRVTVSMMGHGPDWRTEAVRAADELNQPLLPFKSIDRHDGPWGRTLSLIELAGDRPEVAIRAVKRSEQGDRLVVRVQETTGQPVRGLELRALGPILSVDELRADEVAIAIGDDVTLASGALRFDLAPYQPRTFALELATPTGNRTVARTASEPWPLPWNLDGLSTRDAPTDGDLDGHGLTLPSAQIPREIQRDGARYATGPREPGRANLVRCEGQTIAIPDTEHTRVRLLMCSLDGPREAVFARDQGRPTRVWVPDGLIPFGQWDTRVVGEDVVHARDELTGAYTTPADIGWVVTHRVDADGAPIPYEFVHFYVKELRISPPGEHVTTRAITLPDDPALVILGASLVTPTDWLSPACELVDRPASPSVAIVAERRGFIDPIAVAITSPDRQVELTVQRDDGAPVAYDGEPIVLTDTTRLTVTARGPFPETTTRTALFTRLEPWAGRDHGGDTPGLATAVYHGAWESLPDWSALDRAADQTSLTVRIPDDVPVEDVGLVMRGWLEAPRAGLYRFWLSSDDGSRLWIGDQEVVDHDGLHGQSAVVGEAPLAAGWHPITVEFFQHLGGRGLSLEWSGPGFGRQDLPAGALSH